MCVCVCVCVWVVCVAGKENVGKRSRVRGEEASTTPPSPPGSSILSLTSRLRTTCPRPLRERGDANNIMRPPSPTLLTALAAAARRAASSSGAASTSAPSSAAASSVASASASPAATATTLRPTRRAAVQLTAAAAARVRDLLDKREKVRVEERRECQRRNTHTHTKTSQAPPAPTSSRPSSSLTRPLFRLSSLPSLPAGIPPPGRQAAGLQRSGLHLELCG